MSDAWAAYYNEHDKFAAKWLRNLIADGLIAPGEVDERSIEDVRPTDLAGFRQCHFFAGIGGWSYALRLAGWPDDRAVWTGSCPCPPFSSAGKIFRCPICDTPSPIPNALRTGAFNCIRCDHEWSADKRHLWPEFFRLIRECQPSVVFGEQVASPDGRTWLDVVSASLEIAGYAVGSSDLPAAGIGAPHIRQRLWFVGIADGGRPSARRQASASVGHGSSAVTASGAGGLGNTSGERGWRNSGAVHCAESKGKSARLASWPIVEQLVTAGTTGSVEHSARGEVGISRLARQPREADWSDIEWLPCIDGKWRPAKPGTFPLASGVSNRVGRLRGYGNAIVPQVAAEFIGAAMECMP